MCIRDRSYYLSTFISTFIICLIAEGASFIYLANVGWYLSASDILLSLLDVFLLVMFGTALSSIVNFFLTSQGQISAVGTVVSAGYGFICGLSLIHIFGQTGSFPPPLSEKEEKELVEKMLKGDDSARCV